MVKYDIDEISLLLDLKNVSNDDLKLNHLNNNEEDRDQQ